MRQRGNLLVRPGGAELSSKSAPPARTIPGEVRGPFLRGLPVLDAALPLVVRRAPVLDDGDGAGADAYSRDDEELLQVPHRHDPDRVGGKLTELCRRAYAHDRSGLWL